MITPTAADVRSWSNPNFDWDELGYPAVSAPPDPLDLVVAWSVADIQAITGRMLDATLTDLTLTALAQQAVLLRTQTMAYELQPDYQETAADDVVQSFTAGNYSETHVDPIKRAQAKTLTQNPALARILWRLMDEDQADYWIGFLEGKNAPAFDVSEIDWGGWYGPIEPVPGLYGSGPLSVNEDGI